MSELRPVHVGLMVYVFLMSILLTYIYVQGLLFRGWICADCDGLMQPSDRGCKQCGGKVIKGSRYWLFGDTKWRK